MIHYTYLQRRKSLTEEEAAQIIQTAWKGYRVRSNNKKSILLGFSVYIQSKKIFECYRKLISFKQKGDPAVLLKTINPSEVPNFTVLLNLEEFGPHLTDLQAKLLDKASGGCVRFRLGGVSLENQSEKN